MTYEPNASQMLSFNGNISQSLTVQMMQSAQTKFITFMFAMLAAAQVFLTNPRGLRRQCEIEISPWLQAAALEIGTTGSRQQECTA